jgi:hypothetical protein
LYKETPMSTDPDDALNIAVSEASKIQKAYAEKGFPVEVAIQHVQALALIAIADALRTIATGGNR